MSGLFLPYSYGSGGGTGGGGSAAISVEGVGPMQHIGGGKVIGRPLMSDGIVRIQYPDGMLGAPTIGTLPVGSMILTEFYKLDCSAVGEFKSPPASERGKDTFMYDKIALWGLSDAITSLKLGIYTEDQAHGGGIELLSPNTNIADLPVEEGVKVIPLAQSVRRTAFLYARVTTAQALRLNITAYVDILSQKERY